VDKNMLAINGKSSLNAQLTGSEALAVLVKCQVRRFAILGFIISVR